MKKFFIFLFLGLFSVVSFGQTVRTDFDLGDFGIKIETDRRLVIMRTTLVLAGLQSEPSQEGKELREKILSDFKDFDPVLREKLRIFVEKYAARNQEQSNAEIASAFLSMAFALTPAPELAEPVRSDSIPGPVLSVLDYSSLVREFYSSPGVPAKIDKYQKVYDEQAEFSVLSSRDMVREVLDYLHTRPQLSYIERVRVESPQGEKQKLVKYEIVEKPRTFTIAPDVLATKGNVSFLTIKDQYFTIVPSKIDISDSEVRRAYLQFVLDPLVLAERKEIEVKRLNIIALVNEQRKKNGNIPTDPVLAVARSFVAAADIKEEQFRKENAATESARRKIALMKTEEQRLAVSEELKKIKTDVTDEATLKLSEAYENGAVLAFYFAEKMIGTEQSGFDIAGSVKEWIFALDPRTEANRLSDMRNAIQRGIIARERRKNAKLTELIENPLTAELLKADELVTAKKYDEAEQKLNGLAREYKAIPIEVARVYYSLGRMNSLKAEASKDPEVIGQLLKDASDYYKNVLALASPSDKGLISSTYFALGRIYEHFDQDEYALKIYDAALTIGKVESGAFEEAFEAKRLLIQRMGKN
ncbi:MAG: hypothetical protein R2684_15805 [Pyrinomonadaceae bacterium]